jgi:hypothetical protein
MRALVGVCSIQSKSHGCLNSTCRFEALPKVSSVSYLVTAYELQMLLCVECNERLRIYGDLRCGKIRSCLFEGKPIISLVTVLLFC